MKTKPILIFHLVCMGLLLLAGVLFPEKFTALLSQPQLYLHAKFIHILSVMIFFANTIIGAIWEARSLHTGRPEIIRYTYKTVVWFDAIFTAPLITAAVLSGLMLGTILGGVWSLGWISFAFLLFLLSGLVWIVADIPTQHKVNRLFESLDPHADRIPKNLMRLLWFRMAVNVMGIAPLLIAFFLMVHKPDLPRVASWVHP